MNYFKSAIEVEGVAKVFYAFIANKAARERVNPLLKRRLDVFVKKLGEAMQDFGAAACLGEMRHGRERVLTHRIELFIDKDPPIYLDTDSERAGFVRYYIYMVSKKSVLETAVDVFSYYEWEGGYGGGSWGRVAETTLRHLEGEISDEYFIDSMFHIVHNGGKLFDKRIIFSEEKSDFRSWLSARQAGIYDDWFLEGLTQICRDYRDVIEEVIAYDPVAWGSGRLSYYADEIDDRREDEWEEEEDYDEESCEEEEEESCEEEEEENCETETEKEDKEKEERAYV